MPMRNQIKGDRPQRSMMCVNFYNVEPFLKLLMGQKLEIWVLNKIKCTARSIEIVPRGRPQFLG